MNILVSVKNNIQDLLDNPSEEVSDGSIGFYSWDSIARILEEIEGKKIKEFRLEKDGIEFVI